MDHCCVEQLRLPPHFYPVTNRVVYEYRVISGVEYERKKREAVCSVS